jgi:peroxiredoxin Q/BCP
MKKLIIIGLTMGTFILLFSVFQMRGQSPLVVGDKLPSFMLPDQDGIPFDIKDYVGKTAMVIYFYPKDDTPGCTKEACSFRDSFEKFTEKNIKVIGISSDDVESHKNFADKYNLPFTLLADTDSKVRNLFGVKSNILGLIPGRVTYVIDKGGKVIFIYDSQFKAERHIEESIKAINASVE